MIGQGFSGYPIGMSDAGEGEGAVQRAKAPDPAIFIRNAHPEAAGCSGRRLIRRPSVCKCNAP